MKERYEEYVKRIGLPRAVRCNIELGSHAIRAVWVCTTHDYKFDERPYPLDWRPERYRLNDRCPVSRLEEWRARRWEAAA